MKILPGMIRLRGGIQESRVTAKLEQDKGAKNRAGDSSRGGEQQTLHLIILVTAGGEFISKKSRVQPKVKSGNEPRENSLLGCLPTVSLCTSTVVRFLVSNNPARLR
jgi:hypothetical protein